jgi:predicted PilT family ATPase
LVKITFPRDSEDIGSDEGKAARREALKPDEVLLRGGKKGVSGAKAEILEVWRVFMSWRFLTRLKPCSKAVEFEKESNHTAKFTVPTRAVARILGKGGASINAIKDDTGSQIDVDKPADNDPSKDTTITLKGTKKAIGAAKEAILAIAVEVSDEMTEIINIEHKYHRNIIGAGGQNLRDLTAQAGGPADVRQQAGLVHL